MEQVLILLLLLGLPSTYSSCIRLAFVDSPSFEVNFDKCSCLASLINSSAAPSFQLGQSEREQISQMLPLTRDLKACTLEASLNDCSGPELPPCSIILSPAKSSTFIPDTTCIGEGVQNDNKTYTLLTCRGEVYVMSVQPSIECSDVVKKSFGDNFQIAACTLCVAFSALHVFVVMTYILDWKNSVKFPSIIILFVNVCLLICDCVWIIPLSSYTVQSKTLCTQNELLRRNEPSMNSSGVACWLMFSFMYYCIICVMTCIPVLCYCWKLQYQRLKTGSTANKIHSRIFILHIILWFVPLLWLSAAFFSEQISAVPELRICFIADHIAPRATLIVLPMWISTAFTSYFLIQVHGTLKSLLVDSRGMSRGFRSTKIKSTIRRIVGRSIIFVCIVVLVTVLEILSFLKPVRLPVIEGVDLLSIVYVSSYFISSLLIISWIWTSSTERIWINFFKRLCAVDNVEKKKTRKHRLISERYIQHERDNDLRARGQLESLTEQSHDDPMGMRVDMISLKTNDDSSVSSVWLNALPNIVNRRGAVSVQQKRRTNSTGSTSSQISASSAGSHVTNSEPETSERKEHRRHKKLTKLTKQFIAKNRRSTRSTITDQATGTRGDNSNNSSMSSLAGPEKMALATFEFLKQEDGDRSQDENIRLSVCSQTETES